MNKASLVLEVTRRTEMEKPEVAKVVNAVLQVVGETVAKGERVTLAGFGTFERRRRRARLGRNPRTGEAVKIPATVKPWFRPGKAFKQAVLGKRRRRTSRRTGARTRR